MFTRVRATRVSDGHLRLQKVAGWVRHLSADGAAGADGGLHPISCLCDNGSRVILASGSKPDLVYKCCLLGGRSQSGRLPLRLVRELYCTFAAAGRAASPSNRVVLTPLELVWSPRRGLACWVLPKYGLDLKQAVCVANSSRRGKLPLPVCAHIIKGVLQALVATHAAGVIHRDVKPDNIFLDCRSDGEGAVLLGDWGSATCAAEVSGKPALSLTGAFTRRFVPPEVLAGAKPYSFQADMWCVGVTLYYLLTGCKPPTLLSDDLTAGPEAHISDDAEQDDPLIRARRLQHLSKFTAWVAEQTSGSSSATRKKRAGRAGAAAAAAAAAAPTDPTCGLLAALLSINPAARPTAAQALAHPWFQSAGAVATPAAAARCFHALKETANRVAAVPEEEVEADRPLDAAATHVWKFGAAATIPRHVFDGCHPVVDSVNETLRWAGLKPLQPAELRLAGQVGGNTDLDVLAACTLAVGALGSRFRAEAVRHRLPYALVVGCVPPLDVRVVSKADLAAAELEAIPRLVAAVTENPFLL